MECHLDKVHQSVPPPFRRSAWTGLHWAALLLCTLSLLILPGICEEECNYHDTVSHVVLANVSDNVTPVNDLPPVTNGSLWDACLHACCLRPTCNLAWLYGKRCYAVSCRVHGDCTFQGEKLVQTSMAVVERLAGPVNATDRADPAAPVTAARLSASTRAHTGKVMGRKGVPEAEPAVNGTSSLPELVAASELEYIQQLMGPVASTTGAAQSVVTEPLSSPEQRQTTPAPLGAMNTAQPLDEELEGYVRTLLSQDQLNGNSLTTGKALLASSTSPPPPQKPTEKRKPAGDSSTHGADTAQKGDRLDGATGQLPALPLSSANTSETWSSASPPSNASWPPSTATATTPMPMSTSSTAKPVKALVVSTGDSLEVTLPKDEVELNAVASPEPPAGETYQYEWMLISHPEDYQGAIEDKHPQTLKLSKLSAGLYMYKVAVIGKKAYGEGFINVTVKPAPRVNQPPVAIVSPKSQEISLPTSSTFVDGKLSQDDDGIASYRWEQIRGPLHEERVTNLPILHLSSLVAGNYTFRLTVVDTDGVSNWTTANVTVNKAVDYPPVANAGPNQAITLPRNFVTLIGNQSSDDHGIVSYEWTLGSNTKGKVLEMQGVRTPYLQLSSMQEGDYTFQLTVTDAAEQQSTAEVTVVIQPENNRPPVAEAGPDKELTIPVDSTSLDGSKSTDDQSIASYHWEKISGPPGVRLDHGDEAVATVSELQVGTYVFSLTVLDAKGLSSTASVTVTVKEENNKPPHATAGGNKVLLLPDDTVMLDGSRSWDDQGSLSYEWTRDGSSPAAGVVLNGSEHHPVLWLTNLVEGTYVFRLKVTDNKGESSQDMATVEVKPDPKSSQLVELVLDVPVSQLQQQQKELLIRQLSVLLSVLDSDIHVQRLQAYTQSSTQLVFYVLTEQPNMIYKGVDVARMLRRLLQREKTNLLAFRTLRVDTFVCQLACSGHGRCDSFTKRCTCFPFWMENVIRTQLGDGESNCDWSVLYVTLTTFAVAVTVGLLAWLTVCWCRRARSKDRRKPRYSMLNNMDDHEMEMKPSHRGIRKKRPQQSTSIMVSDSDLDSDQETVFSRNGNEKQRLFAGHNGALRNGSVASKPSI
ncbi:dyslexia-associated protein KIAA0319-like protein isoform X2 [Lampetra fluviatilis]